MFVFITVIMYYIMCMYISMKKTEGDFNVYTLHIPYYKLLLIKY